MPATSSVRIGAGQGFYGDTATAAVDMVLRGDVRYIGFDALSELTLAILQKDRQRDASLGYTRDLVPLMTRLLPLSRERSVRLVTNAGGLNPAGAAAAVAQVAERLGISLRIATVQGDDVGGRLASLRACGIDLAHSDSGETVDAIADRILFANAYLGAHPIVEALGAGADVVITGRVADSALFLGPIAHELRWGWEDWDRLAAGTVVGHLLECSGQASGGNLSRGWRTIPEPWRLGYPTAEVDASGSTVISKPHDTGGAVTFETVSEQLLYEVHNPRSYLAPDVVADFTSLRVEDLGDDRVRVTEVRGRNRPETLKLIIGYTDGWMGEGRVGYCWPDAVAKARRAEEILRHRIQQVGIHVQEIRTELQGVDSLQDGMTDGSKEVDEVYLRLAVRTASREEAERFTREFPYLALNGPPGLGGYGGITPPRQLLGLWPARVPRSIIEAGVTVSILEARA